MPDPINITQIPAPRVELIDPRTGLMSREWFRFFNNIYTIVGANLGIVQIPNGGTGLSSYPTNGQLLIGNTAGKKYDLNTLTAGLGINVTNGAGTIGVANTGVLSNVAGAGISVSSATGNVTIANTGVLSVIGTAPVVSSGGTTPAISLAANYGDTLNPYAAKTAHYVLAGPTTGAAAAPTFRALIATDIPSLSGTYIPYTGASSAIDLNAQTVTNIAHLGVNTTSVPTILIRAIGDNNSSSRIAMRGYSSNANSSSIRVTKFRGTFASPQAPQTNDSLGKFELAGYGTTSSDGYAQASYEGVATEMWGATARGTKVLFKVTPNTTTTQVTALTIDQDSSATFASTVAATSFSGSGSNLTGVIKTSAPITKTADFSVGSTDAWLINNKTGSTCTVTLPSPSANTGRVLYFINYQNQSLVSASSNVVSRSGGAAGTAILDNVAGNWATIVSDGTNWITTQAASNNNLLLE